MTEQEKTFLKSLQDKIDKYDIHNYKTGEKLTIREILPYGRNQFVQTHYNDGTPDEIIDVGIETFLYKCSPLLFIEKYGKFELPGCGEFSCKDLYYFQKEILKDFRNYKKIVLTKTRQAGLSTLTSLIFWWKAVNFPGEWLVIISKDGKSSQDFLEKIKFNIPNIPLWMGIKINKNNVKGLSFSNRTKVDSFARSKTAGRGTSPTMVVLDEAAFYGYQSIIEGIVSSVVPALTRVSGDLWIISTANGSAEGSEGYWYYKQVKDLQDMGGHDKLSVLYDVRWWEVPDIDGITPYKGYNEKLNYYISKDYFNNPKVKKEANDFFMPIAKNGWKNNDWLNYQMSTAGKVKYLQEILQNFVVTGNTVFSDEVLERVQKRTIAPIEEDLLNHKPMRGLWVFKNPLPDHKYIIGVDVCKGSSDDSSCIQVVDMHTYDQVAELTAKCTTLDLAHFAFRLGQHYNWAYMIVESNSIGEATFAELYYNLNYPNLFKQKKLKQGQEVMTGWITSTKSRELITNNFIDFYYDEEMWEKYHPYSERLLSQMKYWIWKGGKPDHSGSAHDDNIMAMAIALYNIADGIKKIRNPKDAVFFDENGNAIGIEESIKHEATDRFFNSLQDSGKELDEEKYKKYEEDMYKKAGLDPRDENTAANYRWLLGIK